MNNYKGEIKFEIKKELVPFLEAYVEKNFKGSVRYDLRQSKIIFERSRFFGFGESYQEGVSTAHGTTKMMGETVGRTETEAVSGCGESIGRTESLAVGSSESETTTWANSTTEAISQSRAESTGVSEGEMKTVTWNTTTSASSEGTNLQSSRQSYDYDPLELLFAFIEENGELESGVVEVIDDYQNETVASYEILSGRAYKRVLMTS